MADHGGDEQLTSMSLETLSIAEGQAASREKTWWSECEG